MSFTSFPIPATPLILIPSASSFSPGAHLVTIQDGAPFQIPVPALPSAGYDVRSYGATGNGTTDDSDAIATCFSAAPAGSTIVFSSGTYLMRSPVTIGVDHLTIIGQGAKIISDGANQDRKFTMSGRTGIKFRDLRFDGGLLTDLDIDPEPDFDTFTPNSYPGTIHFLACKNSEVSGCDFYGLNWPVTILGACEVIRVIHNRFEQYTTAVYSYFLEPGGSEPKTFFQPKRITVSNNDFLRGKYRSWLFETPFGKYDDRVTDFQDINCSGAIKFRGEGHVSTWEKEWFVSTYHVVTGNKIRESGQMGIEMQGCANDSVISGNVISSVPIGISLSTIQRMVVADNVVRDCTYTCIECDGWENGDLTMGNNDQLIFSNNVLYGCDDYGRPVNLVDNIGIVVSRRCRNVVISGGSVNNCKSGVVIMKECRHVTVLGVRVLTNLESGTGDNGPYLEGVVPNPYVQGILVKESVDVDIIGCQFRANATAWQRMVNLIGCVGVRVRDCRINANNIGVFVNSTSDVIIQSNLIELGATTGGSGVSFIFLDSTGQSSNDIRILGNVFKGVGANGIICYSPSNTIARVTLIGNDTRAASSTEGNRFLSLGASGSGAITGIVAEGNPGGGTFATAIDIPAIVADGGAGAFTDEAALSTIKAIWSPTINLQTAVGYAGKTKTVINATGSSTVTLHPRSGEKINGSTSDYTFSTLWQRVVLTSDGTDWIAST